MNNRLLPDDLNLSRLEDWLLFSHGNVGNNDVDQVSEWDHNITVLFRARLDVLLR